MVTGTREAHAPLMHATIAAAAVMRTSFLMGTAIEAGSPVGHSKALLPAASFSRLPGLNTWGVDYFSTQDVGGWVKVVHALEPKMANGDHAPPSPYLHPGTHCTLLLSNHA